MINDETREAVAKSRAAQGLPPTVQDTEALARIAHIMRLSEQQRAAVIVRKRRRKRSA